MKNMKKNSRKQLKIFPQAAFDKVLNAVDKGRNVWNNRTMTLKPDTRHPEVRL